MAMSKQARSLVSALLAIGVCALVVWFGYFSTKSAREEKNTATETSARAFDFDVGTVSELTLVARGETVRAKMVDGLWRLTEPVSARADQEALEAIVTHLATLKARDLNASSRPPKEPDFALAPASKAAEFGLESPQFLVSLKLEDGRELELKLAEPNPYDQSRPFLTSSSDSIRLADSGAQAPLDKSVFELRDKTLLQSGAAEVFAFTVSSPAGRWSVERSESGWKLVAPFDEEADKESVDAVLHKIGGARARSFPSETVEGPTLLRYGLENPLIEVTLSVGADKTQRTLVIGEVEESGTKKAYARVLEGGPVMEVEHSLLAELSKSPALMRDRRVAPFEREEVSALEVSAGGESFVITRTQAKSEGGSFSPEIFTLSGSEEKLIPWKISSALYTLSTLKGESIATDEAKDLEAWGLQSPSASYTVKGKEGAELGRVLIGKKVGGNRFYVMKAGSSRVYEVLEASINVLPKTRAELLEKPESAQGG